MDMELLTYLLGFMLGLFASAMILLAVAYITWRLDDDDTR